MNELSTHFTILLSKENYEKTKEEYKDIYLILATKPCNYSQEDYLIIDIAPLDEDPECYELESVLNDFGGLIIHENMTQGFCILEEDIEELDRAFEWDGALGFVIGSMLTPEDKRTLLTKWAKKTGKSTNITLLLENGTTIPFENHSTEIFTDERDKYKFGNEEIAVWWGDVFNTVGGCQVYIQKEDEEELLPSAYHPNPWDKDDDKYYGYYDDYDDYYDNTIPAWYRERDF